MVEGVGEDPSRRHGIHDREDVGEGGPSHHRGRRRGRSAFLSKPVDAEPCPLGSTQGSTRNDCCNTEQMLTAEKKVSQECRLLTAAQLRAKNCAAFASLPAQIAAVRFPPALRISHFPGPTPTLRPASRGSSWPRTTNSSSRTRRTSSLGSTTARNQQSDDLVADAASVSVPPDIRKPLPRPVRVRAGRSGRRHRWAIEQELVAKCNAVGVWMLSGV